jgi:hypothetical protein
VFHHAPFIIFLCTQEDSALSVHKALATIVLPFGTVVTSLAVDGEDRGK